MSETVVESKPGQLSADELKMRKAIRRTLRDYPNIQAGMLSSHIRPYRPLWRKLLEQMILEGEVIRETRMRETDAGSRAVFVHRLATDED